MLPAPVVISGRLTRTAPSVPVMTDGAARPAQPVVSDVSSTRKLVASEESSTPRNFT